MKRFLAILLAAVLLLGIAAAEEEAKYTALINVNSQMRSEPDEDSRRKHAMPKGSKVQVIQWGEDWCRVAHEGVVGWAKTSWLYCLHSMDPMLYPLPNRDYAVTGYAVMTKPTEIKGGEFAGLTAQVGQLVCVEKRSGALLAPVWRSHMALPDSAAYRAFVDWREAASGDIIGGYTTFYGEQLGKGRTEERAYNIHLGCQRVNGAVVESGATFSFNALCAPYKKHNGWMEGPNISSDGLGWGGGVCQLSTTLYNAVLTLPLPIGEWAIHKYSGVQYAQQFFDASVGLYSDFTFVNSLPYPITILTLPQDGMLTVLICRQ
ncbi:MAG: VanW family protein [Clostridia bacterium]|nr:VanW family protein [Clostridia bacterium]